MQVALHQLCDHVSGRFGVKDKRLEARPDSRGLSRRVQRACRSRAAKRRDQKAGRDRDSGTGSARTRRIHLLEAIDLRRLQDIQSGENLREDRKLRLCNHAAGAERLRHHVLTLSCLKKQSIRSSLKTLLQETRFWKTLGIFFKATLRPSRGSVTDLRETACLDAKTKTDRFPAGDPDVKPENTPDHNQSRAQNGCSQMNQCL